MDGCLFADTSPPPPQPPILHCLKRWGGWGGEGGGSMVYGFAASLAPSHLVAVLIFQRLCRFSLFFICRFFDALKEEKICMSF